MRPFNPLFPRSVTFTFIKLVRFINYVKGLLDRDDTITRMSDLLDDHAVLPDGTSREIIKRLLRDRRLVRYDTRGQRFVDEPVDETLIASFFERAKRQAD